MIMFKHIYITLIFCTCYSVTFSLNHQQQEEIDGYIAIAKQFKNTKNQNNYAHFLNKIAYEYWAAKDFQQALAYFQESLKVNENINNNNALHTLNTNLGIIYTELNENQRALEHFILAQKYLLANGTEIQIASGLLNIALALDKMNSYTEAIEKIQNALPFFIEDNNKHMIKHCYGRLYKLYKKLNLTDSANFYFKKYNTFKEVSPQGSLLNSNQTPYMTQHIRDDTQKEIKGKSLSNDIINKLKIDLLRKDKTIAKLKIEAQENALDSSQDIRVVFIIAFLICTIFISLFFFEFKKKSDNTIEQTHLIKSIEEFINSFKSPIFIETNKDKTILNHSAKKIAKIANQSQNQIITFDSIFTTETDKHKKLRAYISCNPQTSYYVNKYTTAIKKDIFIIYVILEKAGI